MRKAAKAVSRAAGRLAGKRVYFFASGKAEGGRGDKQLLGGKGANLADMTSAGLPVPPGFTITTEVCAEYYSSGQKLPRGLMDEVEAALRKVEKATGKKFGADWFGKLKTALQCAALIGAFVTLSLRGRTWAADALPALGAAYQVLLYAMLAATVGSMVQYVVKAARLLR